MSQEKIDQLTTERRNISGNNKILKQSRKWHMQKFEEFLKDAEEHIKRVKEIDNQIHTNNNLYFDKGTQLEELTGVKRIELLR